MNNKLYLCLIDGKKTLLTRQEVDDEIREIEENIDEMNDVTVLGSFNPSKVIDNKRLFLVKSKFESSSFQEVILASNSAEALRLISEKRNKFIENLEAEDITNLVKEYYK